LPLLSAPPFNSGASWSLLAAGSLAFCIAFLFSSCRVAQGRPA
jgi:hypothetical protein